MTGKVKNQVGLNSYGNNKLHSKKCKNEESYGRNIQSY